MLFQEVSFTLNFTTKFNKIHYKLSVNNKLRGYEIFNE